MIFRLRNVAKQTVDPSGDALVGRGQVKRNRGKKSSLITALGAGLALSIFGAQANDNDRVQVSSLEVKSRIATMEQVNVTAEKAINDSAPASSAAVAKLLSELRMLEASSQPKTDPNTDNESE